MHTHINNPYPYPIPIHIHTHIQTHTHTIPILVFRRLELSVLENLEAGEGLDLVGQTQLLVRHTVHLHYAHAYLFRERERREVSSGWITQLYCTHILYVSRQVMQTHRIRMLIRIIHIYTNTTTHYIHTNSPLASRPLLPVPPIQASGAGTKCTKGRRSPRRCTRVYIVYGVWSM